MDPHQQRIYELETQVQQLSQLLGAKFNELNGIRQELEKLKAGHFIAPNSQPVQPQPAAPVAQAETLPGPAAPPIQHKPSPFSREYQQYRKNQQAKLENLIGTNIFNKIGILVLMVGVFIGAKYAIDKDLISPLVRIITGYTLAISLGIIGWRLKSKYEDYSAVMLGGAIGTAYFITYIAYSLYGLVPQLAAFGIMLLTTGAAVWTSLQYNRQVIALLGQVAAYAIPFLLSKGSGDTVSLMIYLSLVNVGLLLMAVFKDWKPVYRMGFAFSWIIHIAALTNASPTEADWIPLMLLLTLNFLLFLGTFLAYKIKHKQLYNLPEITLLLLNSILFFAAGYLLLWDVFLTDGRFDANRHHLSIFTISVSFIHLWIGTQVKNMKLHDESVQHFLIGLSIAFFTILVPIAWKGSFITIFWAAEAASLGAVFRKTRSPHYSKLAAALLFLTLISLALDWQSNYLLDDETVQTPFLNMAFFTTLMVVAALFWLYRQLEPDTSLPVYAQRNGLRDVSGIAFFFLLYLGIHLEIRDSWPTLSAIQPWTLDKAFIDIKLIAFATIYIIVWQYLNSNYLKNNKLQVVLYAFAACMAAVYLTTGFTRLGEIREGFFAGGAGPAWLKLGIRYPLTLLIGAMVWGIKKGMDILPAKQESTKIFTVGFNTLLLAFLCNEFIHWMDVLGYANQYKLGLSIIAAAYAFVLISIGILHNKRHLRVSAILLLGTTLLKVLFYDLSSLSSISKTVVLVILGIILLAASFLYNKFRERMDGETPPPQND
jgi:uncharacterized membrane protein